MSTWLLHFQPRSKSRHRVDRQTEAPRRDRRNSRLQGGIFNISGPDAEHATHAFVRLGDLAGMPGSVGAYRHRHCDRNFNSPPTLEQPRAHLRFSRGCLCQCGLGARGLYARMQKRTGADRDANSLNQMPSGVQLRRRRVMRLSVLSPSKLLGASASSDLSTLSKVLTFTTAYRAPSITHVTIGTIPHVLHTWKSAVFVPNWYWPDCEASAMAIRNRPVGCDVQTPRCFLQCPQPHARTGIVRPGPGQSSVNRMLPQ